MSYPPAIYVYLAAAFAACAVAWGLWMWRDVKPKTIVSFKELRYRKD